MPLPPSLLVWLLLCVVTLPRLDAAPPDTLLNAGFEAGTGNWMVYSGGAIATTGTNPHGGALAARCYNRTNLAHGISQDIRARVVAGSYYTASGWVRTSSATPVPVKMSIVQTDGQGERFIELQTLQVANTWTRLNGSFRYDPQGTVTRLEFYFNLAPAGVEIFVDDASLAPLDLDAPENFLTNAGFEYGATAWAPRGSVTLTPGAPAHSGLSSILVTGRSASWQGVEQSITGKTDTGQPYYGAAWVTTDSTVSQPVYLTLELSDSGGTRYYQVVAGTASSATWTWLSGVLIMPATSGLKSAKFYVEGPAAGVALRVDDAYFAPATGLRRAAASFPALRLGAVSGIGQWRNEPRFRAALGAHFHLSSTENSLKMSDTEPTANFFRYSEANAVVGLGFGHGSAARGHVLVWHSGLPGWLAATSTPAQMQTILWDNLDRTVAAFRGKLPWWDVVNEAFADSSSATTLRSSPWYDAPGIGYAAEGDRYIREAFIRARAADPSAKLFYNDFSIEAASYAKATAVYNMLADFRANGVPVDGIGFQSHFEGIPNAASARANFQRFQDLGLELHVTELDIRMPVDSSGIATAANLATQGDRYFDYLGACLGYANMKVIQTWGVYDGSTWVPATFAGFGQPLLFDFNFDRKPAYWGVWNALAGQAEKLAVISTSGPAQTTFSDITLSANAGRRFSATAVGDSITLRLHVPFAGQWGLRVGALRTPNGGRAQLSFAPPDSSTFANAGSVIDFYASANGAAALTPGNIDFTAPGDWQVRFTIAGKNSASSGYALNLDYLRITPVSCSPAIGPLPDQTLAMGATMVPRLFLAEDDTAQGSLIVTASARDTALVPAGGVVLSGDSPFYSIAVTPAPDRVGSTLIDMTASDGTLSTTRSFALTVPGTAIQVWRQTWFGTAFASGAAADLADPDSDGECNLLEFATGQSPFASRRADLSVSSGPDGVALVYRRSSAAVATGFVFAVETCSDLSAGAWTTTSVDTSILADNGTMQTARALAPATPSGRVFLRLRITSP